MTSDDLLNADRRHLWHPYTDIDAVEGGELPVIARAEGVCLYTSDGKPLLDGISSWWACSLGHGHPKLVEAVRTQAGILQHSILGGMSHPNAIMLAERLAQVTPAGLDRVVFAGDGASAIEAALKMSLQYWSNTGRPERVSFVSLRDAYHGDTLGAMGVGHLPRFHRPFENVLKVAHRADSPHCFHCPCDKTPGQCDIECFRSMEEVVSSHAATTAAVIVEPICQGAAGMRIYPAEYLRRLRALCDEHDILMIADEVAVGFGRTGTMFACDQARGAGISPDIICLGKALTGGYLPMSAAVATDAIYDSFRDPVGGDGTFYHGHTFCGNPITSALALAVLDVYRDDDIVAASRPAAARLAEAVKRIGELDCVAQSASLGMMSAIEIAPEAGGAELASRVCRKAVELGLFVRPLEDIIYLWPPLVTTVDEMDEMVGILEEAIASAV